MSDYIWDYRDPYEWMRRVRTSSLPPLVICCAISGGIQGKRPTPTYQKPRRSRPSKP
jgi:hypothetical protein